MISLKDLIIPKTYYSLPQDNITDEVFIPAIESSIKFDIMTGWFSSGGIAELSTGLSYFLNNTDGVVRITSCPTLDEDDQKAIENGSLEPDKVLEKYMHDYIDDPFDKNALEKHTLSCMAYLISKKRLDIKLAYMREKNALFHKKINILFDGDEHLIITGSTNFTKRALTKNEEQAHILRSWGTEDEKRSIAQIVDEFNHSWEGNKTSTYVLCSASDAIKNKIVSNYQSLNGITAIKNYEDLIQGIEKKNVLNEFSQKSRPFKVPNYINYRSDNYSHQGEAIDSWMKKRGGIMEMCTGAGKTITSLICAAKLNQQIKHLLLVIAVSTRPLLNQWANDVREFNGFPRMLNGKGKIKTLHDAINRLKREITNIEIVICTQHFLASSDFRAILENINIDVFLIADEVHNLGSPSFLKNKPDKIQYRLGLTATLNRYDQKETNELIKYFGEVCYSFGLEDAIGKCLVPYDYFVYPVSLNAEELDRYAELSNELKQYGWSFEKDNVHPRAKEIIRKRRILLEQASGKIDAFKCAFERNENRNLTHTLIFLSDKQSDQIQVVNEYLQNDFGIVMHQVTGKETGSKKRSKEIIGQFKNGKIQALTSMRVLNEGLNVPEITNAYFLASNTVERTWTQRRGRVLRKCDEIGKNKAKIHDFVVTCPDTEEFKSLRKAERMRVREFAILSNNPWSKNGGLTAIENYYKE